jgi:hypothetical protein
MSLVHCLAAYRDGNLAGIQASQRDWSPYLAHFTNWAAMDKVRTVVKQHRNAREVAQLLDEADQASWTVMQAILTSRELRAKSPGLKHDLPACVCLSECTLPGLISHCERYGRFGLVFSKASVYGEGGRPCVYLAEDEHTVLGRIGRGKPTSTPEGRLFALANRYVPPKEGNQIQDYTHEREWRIFSNLELAKISIVALLAPAKFARALNELQPGVPVVPIDTLFEWGA